MELSGTDRSYLLNRSSDSLPRAPDSGSVALEKKYEYTHHEAGIFPENAARQIVALEVAGSSPVGHPTQHRDALTPDILRTQGIWRFERDVRTCYDLSRRSFLITGEASRFLEATLRTRNTWLAHQRETAEEDPQEEHPGKEQDRDDGHESLPSVV